MKLRTACLIAATLPLVACTFGVPIRDRGEIGESGVPTTSPSELGNPSSYVAPRAARSTTCTR